MPAALNAQRETMVAPSLDELAGRGTDNSTLQKSDLIASDRVEGADVYRPSGDKIGRVEYLLIEKATGQVKIVIMSFGGFLGLGKDHRPVPWDALNYNTTLDGYVLAADDDTLRRSPTMDERDESIWDPASRQTIYSHWGLQY